MNNFSLDEREPLRSSDVRKERLRVTVMILCGGISVIAWGLDQIEAGEFKLIACLSGLAYAMAAVFVVLLHPTPTRIAFAVACGVALCILLLMTTTWLGIMILGLIGCFALFIWIGDKPKQPD